MGLVSVGLGVALPRRLTKHPFEPTLALCLGPDECVVPCLSYPFTIANESHRFRIASADFKEVFIPMVFSFGAVQGAVVASGVG
jgi:hypothetical protein